MTDATKRLLSVKGAVDPGGSGVTFTLESEGGSVQTFSASNEVFGAVLRFMIDLDMEARRRNAAAQPERVVDSLQRAEDLDLFLDVRAGRALLRVHTARGRTVQLELSEELLVRVEENLPKVLAEVRRRGQARSH